MALFISKYTAFCYKKLVSSKYELINLLMETAEVPRQWRVKWLERFVLGERRNTAASTLGRFLKKWYIHKLRGVISYVQGSFVFSKDDKLAYRDELDGIKSNWEQCRDIDELLSGS